MNYYPPILDAVAIGLGFGGFLCWISMKAWPAGARRGRLKLAGCLLIGTAAALGGVDGFLFNAHAAHITVEGEILHAVHHGGRGSSTQFQLRLPPGERVASQDLAGLAINRYADQISDGEMASVTYQADSNHVLHVEILSGPHTGFASSDSDGMFGSICAIVLGFVVVLYGIIDFLSDGTATPSPDSDNARPAPDGEVDSESMLRL